MSYAIIPKPLHCMIEKGVFRFSSEMVIYATPSLENVRFGVIDWIKEFLGYKIARTEFCKTDDSINIILDSEMESVSNEGYHLEITESKITIKGKTEVGVFYGGQSLKQLILDSKSRRIEEISCGFIKDEPRFSWRGFMLDSGRHFHPVETIKKLLDTMALLKMNVFHWHLTEDQGWRIEIKKYPKLTEIGSKRKDTNVSYFLAKNFTGVPHEGYYSQEDVKEIVQHAADRFIKVIPEIELPGHSVAAIASYPELSCTGKQIEVTTDRGVFSDVYCAGKESTFTFLQDVLDEVISLFPSEIIHIGGDEVPKKRWRKCLACQKRIKTENLKDENELQVYFTNRIGGYLKSKGKRLMGWNEFLGDTLDPTAICQWWIGKKKTKLTHIQRGRDMVMSNRYQTYLNLKNTISPMRFFYNWDPIPERLSNEYHKNVLGIEAPLWTEPIPTYEILGKHVFPRILAVAEVGWTTKHQRNYKDFERRIPSFLSYLDMLEMPYSSISEANPSKWKRLIRPQDWLLLLGMHIYFFLKGY